jgi:hypothetical protein
MPGKTDPTAPRKKYALLRWVRTYNTRNPQRPILTPKGFNPESPRVGAPAREFVKRFQRATGLQVTGHFDEPTMARLLPPGIRGEVMALAHSEVGEHEWPPGSNAGPVMEYLRPLGIGPGAPWCAAFVTWVLHHKGFRHFPPNPAYVPSWEEWARQHDLLKPRHLSKRGDLWVWNWDGGAPDHIGFCDEGIKGGTTAFYLDGNVGAYGGSVTDAGRPANGIETVIDLVKLHALKG